MLPIAVLPVAGLLLRFGQPDLLDLAYVAAAGNAVFANLGLLFAIGVAVGLAKGNNGAAGLAAVVAYLVTTEGAKVLIGVPVEELGDATGRFADLINTAYKDAAIAKLSVPAGLISGIMAGIFYNLLLYWSRSIYACIIAHSVTNLFLGIYVIRTGSWQFW